MFDILLENEVTVDLVRNEDEIVVLAKVGELGEFFLPKDTSDRVVWATEDEDLRIGLNRFLQPCEVQSPFVVVVQAQWSCD